MLDNDKDVLYKIEKMKENARALGYTKEIIIRIWDRNFESENFDIDFVIEKINHLLEVGGYNKVKKENIEKRMRTSGDALISAATKEIGLLNHQKFSGSKKASDTISKPDLAKLLIQERLKEIQIKDDPVWNAKLPIEVELKKAFELIPRYL